MFEHARRHTARLVAVLSILSPWVPLLPTPVRAEGPPQHLVPMAVDLLRATRDKLAAQSGDSGRALAMKRAYDILKEERVFLWGRKSLEQKGAVPKIAAALGLQQVRPEDLPGLQQFIEADAKGETDRAIREFYTASGRRMPDKKAIDQIKENLAAVKQDAVKGLATSHTIERPDGRQRIRLHWEPENAKFQVIVESDGGPSREPFRTTIAGDVQSAVSEDGRNLELSAVPVENPIQPMTAEDLRRESEEVYQTIMGQWIDQEGNRWVIEPAGGGAPEQGAAGSSPRESRATEIERKRQQLEEIKSSKVYVWKNETTGEVVKQQRFKRLGEPFEYEGEDYAMAGGAEKIRALEQEITELRAAAPNTESDGPPALPEPDEAAGIQPIIVTKYYPDGHPAVFREARLQGNQITARRTMADAREMLGLPETVKQQLIANRAAPEWIELTILRDERTGETRLEGKRWRLHVTYSSGDYTVKRLHTPYSTARVLTRGRIRVASGAPEGAKP